MHESLSQIRPDELPYLDVFAEEYAKSPADVIGPVREQSPLARSERGIEALTYSACRAVYRDPSLEVGQRELYTRGGLTEGRFVETFIRNINNVEGDAHRHLRKIVAPYFAPARVEELRAQTRRWIDAWVDEVTDAHECDFMEVVAEHLPARVFCAVIGASVEDAPRVARLSKSMTKFFLGDPANKEEVLGAFDELEGYANELLDARRKVPDDGLLSGLVAAEGRRDLTAADSSTMVITILTGSTDTTSGQLGLAMSALAKNPDQWRALRRDPDLVATAVPELARYAPGVWATARASRTGGVFEGVAVEPRMTVWSNVIAANSDPEVFERPTVLDVSKRSTHPPLNWGFGHHFCLGRFLAGMELEETLRSLTERWSEFELMAEPELLGVPTLVAPASVRLRFSVAA